MICSLGATKVARTKGQVDRASMAGRVNCMEVPRLEEPIPHIQFGEKVTIGLPLPQPVLVVKVTVDPDFYKMAGLRVPSTKNLKPVKMKLTTDTGAQVVTCNVDKLPGLGLRRKDLISTTVGLECANKMDANVLGVFFGKVVASDETGNIFEVSSLVYVMKNGGDLLSRTALQQLGVLPPNFPKVGQFATNMKTNVDKLSIDPVSDAGPEQIYQPHGQCDPQSYLPCRCPT